MSWAFVRLGASRSTFPVLLRLGTAHARRRTFASAFRASAHCMYAALRHPASACSHSPALGHGQPLAASRSTARRCLLVAQVFNLWVFPGSHRARWRTTDPGAALAALWLRGGRGLLGRGPLPLPRAAHRFDARGHVGKHAAPGFRGGGGLILIASGRLRLRFLLLRLLAAGRLGPWLRTPSR